MRIPRKSVGLIVVALAEVGAELGRPGLRWAPGTLACLARYAWPGNIRELRNEIARAAALSDDDLLVATAFSRKVLQGQTGVNDTRSAIATLPQSGTLAERLDAIEATILREAMLRLRWNKTRAAEELGLSRVGLRAKLQRFGLEDKPEKRDD